MDQSYMAQTGTQTFILIYIICIFLYVTMFNRRIYYAALANGIAYALCYVIYITLALSFRGYA